MEIKKKKKKVRCVQFNEYVWFINRNCSASFFLTLMCIIGYSMPAEQFQYKNDIHYKRC